MSIREAIAKFIAPGMKGESEVRDVVKEEIHKARMSLPITSSYDPDGDGYRRLAGGGGPALRDLIYTDQDRMFEVAYFMFDQSAMTKRLAAMDRGFIFGESFTVTSEDEAVQEIIDAFLDGNGLIRKYPDRAMWLSLLGEQIWPVEVNPANGFVKLKYEDPSLIKEVFVRPDDVEERLAVELRGRYGLSGRRMQIIRPDEDFRSKTFGRLMGDCFFWTVNAPPNSARGRSDFLTLFDWIDSLERYGFNYLERAELMLNFVWDVTLKGMNEEEIRNWLRDNPPPTPGSQRAHNEQVEWDAVAPDLKAADMTSGFNMGKSFIMGAAGRPDSWFGGGGKAYQTEAEQFGQVPIKDLDERQKYHGEILTRLVQFAVDQAVIRRRLNPQRAEAGFTVRMPEISRKDLAKMVNGIPQLSTALSVAESSGWVTRDEATRFFSFIAGYLGYQIDAERMIDEAGKRPPEALTDYDRILNA